MKKILSAIFSLALLFSVAKAATSTKVATTSNSINKVDVGEILDQIKISSATSTKLDEYVYGVYFRINNPSGLVSNIKYGVLLIRTSDSETVDTQLANESLTLKEGDYRQVKLTYTIPSFIPNGDYKLAIVVEAQKFVPIVYDVSPSFEVKNNPSGLSIKTCTANGKLVNKASLLMDKGQKIDLVCEIDNKSKNNKLSLTSVVHKDNMFGQVVSKNTFDVVPYNESDKRFIKFSIDSLNATRAFYVDNFFVNNSEKQISSSLGFTYLVKGPFAVIQTVVLDKTAYTKGDVINAKILTIASGTNLLLKANILDSNNQTCGSNSQSISYIKPTQATKDIKISLEKDCNDPKLFVSVNNESGDVLDEANVEFDKSNVVNKEVSEILSDKGETRNALSKVYVVIFIIVLALIGYGMLKLKKPENEYITSPSNNHKK